MPPFKANRYFTSHTAGELDPELHGRIDVANYFHGTDKLRNVYALPQGGFARRPGLRFVGGAPLDIDFRCRLIPFHSSSEFGGYVVVVGFDDIHIYNEDGTVLKDTIAGTGFGLITQKITWTQTTDSLILFLDGRLRPRRLRRVDDTTWTLSDLPLRSIPQHTYPDTPGAATSHVENIKFINFSNNDLFTIFINGTETAPITYSTTAATTQANIKAAIEALPFISSGGGGDITVAAITGAVLFSITFAGTVDGVRFFCLEGDSNINDTSNNNLVTFHTTTKGIGPQEDVWADIVPFVEDRGWPRCGVFFQNRLWMAGSPRLPNFLWASRIGDAEDFELVDDPVEDSPIKVEIDVETSVEIYNMFVGRHLQLFGSTSEFYVPVSETEVVTPANIVVRSTTSIGTVQGGPIYSMGGLSLFLQRKARSIRGLLFIDTEQAYKALSLTKNARHLLEEEETPPFNAITRDIPLTTLAFRKSSNPRVPDMVFAVNERGHLYVLSVDQEEQVLAAQQWETNGHFLDVCVVNEQVFVLVDRAPSNAGTNSAREEVSVEVFDDRLLLDMATIVENLGAPVSQSSDLTYMETTNSLTFVTVEGIVDGRSQGTQQFNDTDTIFEFDPDAADSWQVGLPFPDVKGDGSQTWVRTLPLEIPNQQEPLMGRKKSFSEVVLRLIDTGSIWVQEEQLNLETWPTTADLTRSGDFVRETLQDSDILGQISIHQKESRPLKVLAYLARVSVGAED